MNITPAKKPNIPKKTRKILEKNERKRINREKRQALIQK